MAELFDEIVGSLRGCLVFPDALHVDADVGATS